MSLKVKMTRRKGRGVFALANFRKGDVVEVCPVIALITNDECPTKLEPYPYEWTRGKCAIVGGYASFYNHCPKPKSAKSKRPNVEMDVDKKNKTITFTCIAPITKGDEVTFDYREENDEVLGFQVKT